MSLCYRGTQSILGVLLGVSEKYVGRNFIFLLGALCSVAALLLLVLWPIDGSTTTMLYVESVLLGTVFVICTVPVSGEKANM